MATSQNGYSANDRSVIGSYTVPGTTLKIALRKGDVSVVLLEYLRRYHLEVESLYNTPQDLWGYAERTIRGSATTLSNHASGTSADARAVKNGLGRRNTFTPEQEAAIDRLLAWFEGVLRHGKDYRSRPDPMHVEINKGPAEVRRIADKIRSLHNGATSAVAATTPTLAPSRKADIVIDNIRVQGDGTMRLICPVGNASALTSRAFLSSACDGPDKATVRGWFQSDRTGISEFAWTINFRDGISDRPYIEFPDGATQVNLHYSFPNGGVLCLEAMPK